MKRPPLEYRPTPRGASAGSRSDAAYTALLVDLKSGRYRVGDFLPSVRELATHFKASITPVVRALQQLETDGFVERLHGSGVRVARIPGNQVSSAGALVVIPAMRPLQDYNVTEARLNRHVSYASEGWIVNQLLRQEDIRVQLSPLKYRESDSSFIRILEQLLESPPNALCFATPTGFSDRSLALLSQLKSRNVAIGFLVSDRNCEEFDRVVMDFEDGQYQLTKYILSLGHKSIIRLCAVPEYDWERQKQVGYERALADAGFPAKYAKESTLNFGVIQGAGAEVIGSTVRVIGAALDRHKPTVIFACDDTIAGLIRVTLRFLGRADVLVTGYDNKWFERDEPDPFHLGDLSGMFPQDLGTNNPPISVECQRPEAGVALANLVLDRLHGKLPSANQVIKIGQKLFIPNEQA